MDMPVEQQRKLIEKYAGCLEGAQILTHLTAYEHMIVACTDAVTCNLMIEMLSNNGFTAVTRKGRNSDIYYLKIPTLDPSGDLMAFCSAINSHRWIRHSSLK